jgi:hypothetical protein
MGNRPGQVGRRPGPASSPPESCYSVYMSLLRSVEPELLDRLSAADRRAIRARRDLKRPSSLCLDLFRASFEIAESSDP